MKLVSLYSNKPEEFSRIDFKTGLNLVVAEIRIPANRDLDTHNLGKTTVGQLIDYCLLKSKRRKFFLFKHYEIFSDYVFFLELELDSGQFLTVARPVSPGSRCSFLLKEASVRDAREIPENEWDHWQVSFERSRVLLDGYASFDVLKPWGFRKLAGYLVRSQPDYMEVFQLGKFSGKHQDWKPFVSHLLGLSGSAVNDLYQSRESLSDTTDQLRRLMHEWGDDAVDPSTLDALMSVKRRDIKEKHVVLNSFDFGPEDSRVTTEVVDGVDASIADLNEKRYRLQQLVRRITESLEQDRVIFRPNEAEKLFREAGVELGEQVKRTFEQLIEFNRSISAERRAALKTQVTEAEAELLEIDECLETLNSQRARSLEYLRESEALAKYREISEELVALRSDLLNLESRREAAARLSELRREQRSMRENLDHAVDRVETEIDAQSKNDSSKFGQVRKFFNEIIHDVLGRNAILVVRMNQSGGVDFAAEFIDTSGLATAEDEGTSYKKLMCIAFDLAVLRANLGSSFPRFVYHDGAFEQLETRKREKLLGVLRYYASLGIQPIASALDSDLSISPREGWAEDVVVLLHDEGQGGRLFKRPAW